MIRCRIGNIFPIRKRYRINLTSAFHFGGICIFLKKWFSFISEVSADYFVSVWAFEGDLFESLGIFPLKSFSASSKFSSMLPVKRNLFEYTERRHKVRLKERSKGTSSLSQQSPGEPCDGAFSILEFSMGWRYPPLQTVGVSVLMLIFSCGCSLLDLFNALFKFV